MKKKVPNRKLTIAYSLLFRLLSKKEKYCVRTVYEHYVENKAKPDPNKITIILRIDVDSAAHLTLPLAEWLNFYGIKSSNNFFGKKLVAIF